MNIRFIKGVLSITASTVFAKISGFASVAIAARLISEEDMGGYFLIFAMVSLLDVLGNMGLRVSAARFVASAISDNERSLIINNILTLRWITILLVCCFAILAKPLFLWFFPSIFLNALFYFVPILFAVQITEGTLGYLMQGLHLYRQLAIVQILTATIQLALVVLLVVIFDYGITGFLLATILSLGAGALTKYLMIPVRKNLVLNRHVLKRILTFGLPLQVNDFLDFIITKINVLLLASLAGPASVAYFEIAAKIPNAFRELYVAIHSVFLPHMSEYHGQGQKKEADRLLNNVLRMTAFITVLAALILFLFSHELTVLLFSDKYHQSADALGLLMLVVSLGTIGAIMDTPFIATGRPLFLLAINTTVAVITLLGGVILIPITGVLGAVYARLIAEVSVNPLVAWRLSRDGMGIDVTAYLKPFVLYILCLIIFLSIGWNGIAFRVGLILLFSYLCMLFSIVKISDSSLLFRSFKTGQGQEVPAK